MKKYLYFLMLILMISTAFALSNTEYTEQGYADGQYITGSGIFYNGADNFNPQYTGARSLTLGNYTPLVADLDGDGTNEIITLDNNLIRLFHANDLSIVSGGTYAETFTAPLFDFKVYDIDGNGRKEILFAKWVSGSVVSLDIIQYDGTSTTLNKTIPLGTGVICQVGGCDVEFICGKTNECVAGITNTYSTTTGDRIFYQFFNFTNSTTADTYHFSSASGLTCLPKIKSAQYGDYDSDGTSEYIFSAIDSGLTLTNHEFAILNYVAVNGTNFAKGEREITVDLGDILKAGGSDTCDNGVKWVSDSSVVAQGQKSMVTNPFVYDILGGTSSGAPLQTVIAYMKERDSIEMKAFNPDSSALDTFPASGFGDGFLISDIFRVDAFVDGKTSISNKAVDFCVAGFTSQESTSNACGNDYNGEDLTSCASLLCASKIGFVTKNFLDWDSAEYVLPLNNLYNISTSSNMHNTIVHSGQMNGNGVTSNVIWTYGVSSFSEGNCEDGLTTKPICYIGTDYNISKQNGIVVPVDAQNNGKNDLLVQQQTSLWYLDDGFTNHPAQEFCTTNTTSNYTCTGWQLSPCTTNGAWQINTTVLATITPKDLDTNPADTVRARAIIYYNSVYAQDSNWSNNYTQGTSIPFTFIASQLATSATIRFEASDSGNPTTVRTYDLPFTVANIGSVNGDCTEGILTGTVSVQSNYSLAQLTEIENKPNTADNPIHNALSTVNTISGGGLGLSTLWLIIMAIVAYAIWTSQSHDYGTDPRGALGVIAIVEVVMIILGTFLGFFGVGLIVIFAILGILVIAMMVRNVITGSGK